MKEKTLNLFFASVIIISAISGCKTKSSADDKSKLDSLIQKHKNEILSYQEEMNLEFADSNHSPLDSVDFVNFKALDFYPPDFKYRVTADIVKAENQIPFKMPTTTDRSPEYIKFGELHFKLSGEKLRLSVYQNIEQVKNEAYKDYLFLPFTDLTNGLTTYGGGRYIDLRYNGEEIVILDFNKAYNPYCAYAHRWSCPIPPEENDLSVEIMAGVKAFH